MMKLTDCVTWNLLAAHYNAIKRCTLNSFFQETTDRFEKMSLDISGVLVDYSKNFITEQTLSLLGELAREKNLSDAIQYLISGEKINTSENRAALHTRLRSPTQDPEIAGEFRKISVLAAQFSNRSLQGFSKKPIETILHIGMGGSGIGPALYYDALKPAQKPNCYFLMDYDHSAIEEKLALCDPEKTAVVVVSKSFATYETIKIFQHVWAWLSSAARHSSIAWKNCFAVTEKIERATAQGFLSDHVFKIWDWVGGRYSVWSPASFSVMLALGMEKFNAFLRGAFVMDTHFIGAPFETNIPVIMGLLSIWYHYFFRAQTHAIVPYSARLQLLPKYLQQLHMESLGKSVNTNNEFIDYPTGKIIWGDVGPASQHSFHQLLMQGSHFVPVDFILPFSDRTHDNFERAAFCLSQSQTLMNGFDATPEKTIIGNRSSTTILMKSLTPETLGAMLAMYEHSVFVQSVLLDINAFDQWGVERAKQVARDILNALQQKKTDKIFDDSTQGLLQKIIGEIL